MAMSTPATLDGYFDTLSDSEKAAAVGRLHKKLHKAIPGIEKQPNVCGGSACIVRTRIPVWLLSEARDLGTTDEHLLEAYPQLRLEDLANAWAYVAAFPNEVAREIAENIAD